MPNIIYMECFEFSLGEWVSEKLKRMWKGIELADITNTREPGPTVWYPSSSQHIFCSGEKRITQETGYYAEQAELLEV